MPEKQTMERARRERRQGKSGRATGSRTTAKRGRAAAKSGSRHASTASGAKRTKRWSAGVMARSDAMDLETGVFKLRSAKQVALSLKQIGRAHV